MRRGFRPIAARHLHLLASVTIAATAAIITLVNAVTLPSDSSGDDVLAEAEDPEDDDAFVSIPSRRLAQKRGATPSSRPSHPLKFTRADSINDDELVDPSSLARHSDGLFIVHENPNGSLITGTAGGAAVSTAALAQSNSSQGVGVAKQGEGTGALGISEDTVSSRDNPVRRDRNSEGSIRRRCVQKSVPRSSTRKAAPESNRSSLLQPQLQKPHEETTFEVATKDATHFVDKLSSDIQPTRRQRSAETPRSKAEDFGPIGGTSASSQELEPENGDAALLAQSTHGTTNTADVSNQATDEEFDDESDDEDDDDEEPSVVAAGSRSRSTQNTTARGRTAGMSESSKVSLGRPMMEKNDKDGLLELDTSETPSRLHKSSQVGRLPQSKQERTHEAAGRRRANNLGGLSKHPLPTIISAGVALVESDHRAIETTDLSLTSKQRDAVSVSDAVEDPIDGSPVVTPAKIGVNIGGGGTMWTRGESGNGSQAGAGSSVSLSSNRLSLTDAIPELGFPPVSEVGTKAEEFVHRPPPRYAPPKRPADSATLAPRQESENDVSRETVDTQTAYRTLGPILLLVLIIVTLSCGLSLGLCSGRRGAPRWLPSATEQMQQRRERQLKMAGSTADCSRQTQTAAPPPRTAEEMELDKVFHEAINVASERMVKIVSELSSAERLMFFAVFKQATVGDVTGVRPSDSRPAEQAKYEAWAQLAGTPQDSAKREYIAMVDAKDSTWRQAAAEKAAAVADR